MKLSYIVPAVAICFVMVACGGRKTDAEGNPIETEAQIDSARIDGREAARKIILQEWTDSMQFQNAVLEARARKSKYEMAKRHASEAAFDSAFISTIRTTRPDLAKELE